MESLAITVGRRLAELRMTLGLTPEDVERDLTLGEGWVSAFENADVPLTFDVVSALAAKYGATLDQVMQGLVDGPDVVLPRALFWSDHGAGVSLRFPYGKHDAHVELLGASAADVKQVVDVLRVGLASQGEGASMSDAVAKAFAVAVELMPQANPSDLWYFLVQRAFLDPLNHPARNSRLDLGQSWKRTGGWALEKIVVNHYRPLLLSHGIEITVLDKDDKRGLRDEIEIDERVEVDKVDVVLRGVSGSSRHFFGVVHVKASFAERRTDDVPLSTLLIRHGYFSPLWTMDCKATPGSSPINRGELGIAEEGSAARSAKRKDIEEDASFSACFSYNLNTKPTPDESAASARVYACGFAIDTEDQFITNCVNAWDSFRLARGL